MSNFQSSDPTSGFGERIRRVRGSVPMPEFAQVFGIHKNTLARYEKGESLPDAGFLAQLCKAYDISPSWILLGKGPQTADFNDDDEVDWRYAHKPDPDLYVYIPLYNVVASGGSGSFPENEKVVDALAFKREWIKNELKTSPKNLVLVTMTGESMEPTLGKDDVLLVDKKPGLFHSDGIFLVRAGDALLVKRLQFLPNSDMRISSDNPAYTPFFVRPESDTTDFKIIGRIVWAGRRF